MSNFRVQEASRADWPWLIERLDLYITGAFCAIKAVDRRKRIVGMVGYDHWTKNSVQIHIATDHPAAWRALLGEGLRYPFEQAGMGVVVGIVRADNEKSLKFTSQVGFQMVKRFKGYWDKEIDLLAFELRREDWLKLREDPTSPCSWGRRF